MALFTFFYGYVNLSQKIGLLKKTKAMKQKEKFIVLASLLALISYLVFLLVPALLFTSTAHGNTKTPREVVKTGIDQAKSIIDNPSIKYGEKRKQLHDILLPFFDTEEMAKRALGSNKKALGQDKKKYEKRLTEFTSLFIELIENQYLRLSTIDSAKYAEIIYGKEILDGNYAIVDTKILTKKGTSTPVSYRLVLKNGEWKVFDIIVEGVSLIANYRSQFNRILNQGSVGGKDPLDFLLNKMSEKIAEAKSRD